MKSKKRKNIKQPFINNKKLYNEVLPLCMNLLRSCSYNKSLISFKSLNKDSFDKYLLGLKDLLYNNKVESKPRYYFYRI